MSESHSKTRYFLFELIINCLFFAISAAICLNLFTYGFIQNQESRELSMATLEAQSVVETVKAGAGDIYTIAEFLQSEAVEDEFHLYYDRDWQRVAAPNEALYTLTVKLALEDNGLQSIDISVDSLTRNIYMLTARQYLEREVRL